jgi:hypothetical protein
MMATPFETSNGQAGVSFERARYSLEEAAARLFRSDPRIQAVGIGRFNDGYGFGVIRNSRVILPASAAVETVSAIDDIPVLYSDAYSNVESLAKVPVRGPGSPGQSSLVLEQQNHDPLCCGLQIQNFDYDDREGHLGQNFMTIGTLGCFVQLADKTQCILSNNHVIAGVNQGKHSDRILQPGSDSCKSDEHIATLHSFVDLNPSPHNADPDSGNVNWNEVDVALAVLTGKVPFNQEYLSYHGLAAQANGGNPPQIAGVGIPQIGDYVFKIGRTTGLTRGVIKLAGIEVKKVNYPHGECWFRESFVIQSYDGTIFSDYGDSGSAIVNEKTGEIVGLLYATNGRHTFACPIDLVLQHLDCELCETDPDIP